MPLSIKCWQLSLCCFRREHILFSYNNVPQSSFTVGVSMLQEHSHKRLKTCRVKYLSLNSIKPLSTTSGEISPTTNRIINLLFSSFKGIRDNLQLLLEEDLSSINLCALHCELRNTEELLSSLGLLFAVEKDNIQVPSFSGTFYLVSSLS